MDSALTLIRQDWDYSAEDNPDPDESGLEVPGTLGSIGREDWYNAGREGLRPGFVFTTALVNYSGEREARLGGKRYAIYRTYITGDEIELYLEERAGVCDEDSAD